MKIKNCGFLIAITLAVVTLPNEARAASKIASCIVSSLKSLYLNQLMANFQNRTLSLEELDGSPVTLKVGKSLGAGFAARAYRLEGITSSNAHFTAEDDVVVKIAHTPFFNTDLPASTKGSPRLLDEYAEQQALYDKINDIWNDPVMQAKSERWVTGQLPFAKVALKLDTRQGTLLFKNRVIGKKFEQLVAEYGNKINNWPQDMQQSFRDIYDVSQSIHDHVSLKGNDKFTVDLFPDNFFWVSDPAQFSKFGIKRPSFVFIELTHLPASMRKATFHVERGDAAHFQRIMDQYLSIMKTNVTGKEGPQGGAMKARFQSALSPVFLQGEQELQGTTPLFLHPGNLAGRILPQFGMLKNIPLEYQPASGSVFDSYAMILPAEDVNVYRSQFGRTAETDSVIHPSGPDGKPDQSHVYYFYHPLDKSYVESNLRGPIEVRNTTTTSSGRTLAVMTEEGDRVDMIKESLHAKEAALGGFIPKVNGPARVEKAVVMSDAIHALREQSGGTLPLSGKTWDVMEEYASVIPKNPNLGGYIVRDFKSAMKPDEEILTWYALFSKRPGEKQSWIQYLYEKSGYQSKLDFAWNELVKPTGELHSILAFQNDFGTQLHQQNTMLAFNKETGKITRIVFRDIEGMSVGHTIRTRYLRLPPLMIGNGFQDSVKAMEFARDAENQAASYFDKFRTESVKWAFGGSGFLDPISLQMLLGRLDKFTVAQFNASFPDHPITKITQMKKTLASLERSLETPEEAQAYASQRSQSKNQDYIEMMGRVLNNKESFTPEDQHH